MNPYEAKENQVVGPRGTSGGRGTYDEQMDSGLNPYEERDNRPIGGAASRKNLNELDEKEERPLTGGG